MFLYWFSKQCAECLMFSVNKLSLGRKLVTRSYHPCSLNNATSFAINLANSSGSSSSTRLRFWPISKFLLTTTFGTSGIMISCWNINGIVRYSLWYLFYFFLIYSEHPTYVNNWYGRTIIAVTHISYLLRTISSTRMTVLIQTYKIMNYYQY